MVSAFNPYNTLPVADEALDLGGVELLRAGFADKRLFVSLHRHAIDTPDRWGEVLAEVTLNLATLYSADGAMTENDVIAAVAAGFRDALRTYLSSSPDEPAEKTRPKPSKSTPSKSKPVKSTRPKMPARTPVTGKTKALAKSKAKVKAPLKAKAKSLSNKSLSNKSPAKKSKSASKAVAGRKGARG
jgi:Domain of unknown function (DUF5076)